MALKILNDKEILLLSDEQRMQYEEELEMYRQRTAFVEQLEKIENARIKPFDPQLKPVSRINRAIVKSFSKKKYAVHMEEEPVKPLLKIKPFEKVNRLSPNLPELDIALAKKISFTGMKTYQPVLLNQIDTNIRTININKNIDKKIKHSPENIPETFVPNINIDFFSKPLINQTVLPETAITAGFSKKFVKKEIEKVKLPVINKVEMDIAFSKNTELQKIQLPEFKAKLNVQHAEFKRPEYPNYELPVIKEIHAEYKNFTKPEYSIGNLPTVSGMKAVIKEFGGIQNSKIELPELTNISNMEIAFEMKEIEKKEIPVIDIPDIQIMEFKGVARKNVNMTAPSIPNIETKAFVRHERTVPELPEINISDVSDICLKAKNLFAADDNRMRERMNL